MEALEVVEQWSAGGRKVPAGGNEDDRPVPQRQVRQPRRQKRLQDMTEEEIVAMNNRSLAFVQAKMPSFEVKGG